MSMYNNLFGENEDAVPLLGMINCTRNDFQRYRDVYLNKEGTVITVVARIGGGNRPAYRQVFNNMMRHELYIQSYDDDYDKTYAYFEFKVPEKYAATCKLMAPKVDRLSVGDMFKKECAEMSIPGTDAYKKAKRMAEMIFGNGFADGDGPEGIKFIKM